MQPTPPTNPIIELSELDLGRVQGGLLLPAIIVVRDAPRPIAPPPAK